MLTPQPEETAPSSDSRRLAGADEVQIQLLRSIVIEPDLDTGALVASLAGNRGHEVAVVRSAAEAQALLVDTSADFLLLRLNHQTAAEVATFLKEYRGKPSAGSAYCIALTDDDEPSSRVEAWLKRGFDDFITHSDQQNPALLANRLAVAEQLLLRQRARDTADAASVRSARRFEDLFGKTPEAALIATAREGYIVEANPAAEHLLGLTRADLVQRYLSLVLPDLFDHEEYDPQVVAVNDTIRLGEVRHKRPDHTIRWLDVTLTKIPWPPGQALFISFHDITLLRERESRRLLEARQEAAGRVLMGVARELSDSLTTVQGNLELLARLPSTRAETRDLISAAQSGCEDAEDLSRRLTSLARRQQGLDLKRRPLHLRPLLEKAIPFALLGGKSRPVLHVSDDLWPVDADEAVLTDAIRRLVQNADTAMPEGGTLFVDARNVRERRMGATDQTGVCIRMRDQGVGIPAEHLSRVFDPFYSTQGRDGMGLAFAAAVVRAHGGHISLESQPGDGTTVSIWLPVNIKMLLSGGVPPPLPADLSPPNVLATAVVGSKARVLFMDDEDQIRVLVHKILTTHGFDVYCTRDGQEAIDAFRKAHEFGAPFDVLLMDLDVRGGMGGMEAVARLRSEFPNLKALLTTGYIDDSLLDSHREHGFVGVIPKPFQIERLVGIVSKLAGVNT